MATPIEARTAFARALAPGEELLWTGRPDQSHWLARYDALVVAFGLLWFLVGLSTLVGARGAVERAGSGPVLVAWWAVAAAFVAGVVWLPIAYRVRHAYYGVSDRRVLVLSSKRKQQLWLDWLPLDAASWNYRLQEDGSGDITFRDGRRRLPARLRFRDVPDARRVVDHLVHLTAPDPQLP